MSRSVKSVGTEGTCRVIVADWSLASQSSIQIPPEDTAERIFFFSSARSLSRLNTPSESLRGVFVSLNILSSKLSTWLSSVLLSDKFGNDMLCSILFLSLAFRKPRHFYHLVEGQFLFCKIFEDGVTFLNYGLRGAGGPGLFFGRIGGVHCQTPQKNGIKLLSSASY